MRQQPEYTFTRDSRVCAALSSVLRAIAVLSLVWALTSSGGKSHAQRWGGYNIYYVAPDGNCGGQSPCYASIQAAVDAVDHVRGVVKVAKGTYSSLTTRDGTNQTVYIDKQLVLQGGFTTSNWDSSDPSKNPTIIDPQGRGRGVVINNAAAILDGFEITGGDATKMGGVRGYGDAGGGVYVKNAPATIRNCVIHHNVACTEGRSGGRGGGVAAVDSPVTLVDNTIRDNTASTGYFGTGGGVYLNSVPELEEPRALLDDVITLSGNTIQSNIASTARSGNGGGVAFVLTGDDLTNATLTGNTVRGNTASTVAGGKGGGLYFEAGTFTLSENTVSGNVVGTAQSAKEKIFGGGLYARKVDLTLTGNQFLNNIANTGTEDGYGIGGGLYIEGKVGSNQLVATGNNIEGNVGSESGAGFGGGLCMRGMEATLADNTLSDNFAGLVNSAGGGLFLGPDLSLPSSHITMTQNIFQSNTAATHENGSGGGLYMGVLRDIIGWEQRAIAATVDLADNEITSNTACTGGEGYGGGLLLGKATFVVLAEDNLIRSNIANTGGEGYGGGLYMVESGATVKDNTIRDNSASTTSLGYGGGIGASMGVPLLSGNSITGNIASEGADGFGGGVYAFWSGLTLRGNTIRGNSASTVADGYGGGFWVDVGTGATLDSNTIVGNVAAQSAAANGQGGGVWANESDSLALTNNIIGDNQAPNEGSGIWFGGSGSAFLIHNTIANNNGPGGQGLYGSVDFTVTCTNTIISGHTTAGVVSPGDSTITLVSTLWYDNATNWGGSGTVVHTDDHTGDPAYVAPRAGDFHIRSGSRAIDIGINSGVTEDIDGQPRPWSEGYDIGADEQVSGPIFSAYLPIAQKP